MIEYVLKGYSKAAGLAAMLRDLGASREEAYAIGDSTNDLPMFEAAGHTAALGDGMAELQAKCRVHYGAGAGKRPGTGVKTLEIDMKNPGRKPSRVFFYALTALATLGASTRARAILMASAGR